MTILAKQPKVSYQGGRGIIGQAGRQSVLVTGQELARLSSAGQYIPAPGGAQAPTEEFTIRDDKKGILKIDGLLSGAARLRRSCC